MKYSDFETLAAQALGSVFAFADFTKRTEHLFDESTNAAALQAYRSAWFELEIVNATALDEWETDGRPRTWDTKWNERFLKDAEETVGMVKAAAQKLVQ
jgi:hypothetical protein